MRQAEKGLLHFFVSYSCRLLSVEDEIRLLHMGRKQKFSELKITHNTVTGVEFADLECEASIKPVPVCVACAETRKVLPPVKLDDNIAALCYA